MQLFENKKSVEEDEKYKKIYKKEILEESVMLPQAGIHMTLPLINRMFGNNNLVAEFATNGALLEFHYMSAERATALSQTLSETATTIEGISSASKNKKLNELQTKIALLKAEAELIKAQRDLDALNSSEGDN